jgi:acyl carrier protein
MTHDPTMRVVLAALATQLEIPAEKIDEDTPLVELPGMESVLLLRAIAMIEEELEIVIADDILFEASTSRQLADLVRELQ